MKYFLTITAVITFLAIGSVFAPGLEAKNNTCTIRAIKDVNLQAHYSNGGRKSPSIRSKRDVIWSGNMRRGGILTVTTRNGWVHLNYQDLTLEDPRSENNDTICQNGNVILVPR